MIEPKTGAREWSYYCEFCHDLGTRSFMCGESGDRRRYPWLSVAPCGRAHQVGYGHEWAEPCACRDTNPAVRRRRERDQRRAEEAQR